MESIFKIYISDDGVTREIILPNIGWFFGPIEVGIAELGLKLE
jgi:hypothetical protein